VSDDKIYVLRHEYELDGYDSMKILGVYSTLSLAENAQARFAVEPGFRDHQDGFVIHECRMDDDLWSGGFVTYRFPLS
jgi:hypothetical protein